MLENLYTTKMSGNTRILQKRFNKIRSKNGRMAKMMALAMTCVLLVVLGTAIVVMAAVYNEDAAIKYEVYNGNTEISLKNVPFIADGEYYLPLQEVLNGFGITDITDNNGKIVINFPEAGANASARAELETGAAQMWYTCPEGGTLILRSAPLRSAPLTQNGITYVSVEVFEKLMGNDIQQIPNFRLNVIRPTEPEYYHAKDEPVFIGTAAEQDSYTLEHGEKIVKRIIIDEQGQVIAVVPVENQLVANIEEKCNRAASWSNYAGYDDLFYSGVFYNHNSQGEAFIMSGLSVVENANKQYAYVSPADIISIPENEFNRDMRRVITNTYGE